MTQTRTLRVGSKGDDVFRVKQRLFVLGCYAPHITQVTTSNFGRDTQRAVVNFQTQNSLQADGVIGPLTLAALFPEDATAQPAQIEIGTYPNISKTKLASILAALEQTSEIRRAIVQDALQFAFDPSVPRDYPLSLYIRGGNLYNADLAPNVITLSRIQSGAKAAS